MKHSERPWAVHYYLRGEIHPTRTSFHTDLNRAVQTAFGHMQINHYGARVAQVVANHGAYDLQAEIVRRMSGKIETTYHYDTRDAETRYSIASVFGE